MERLIGYLASLVVVTGMGWGLPRWFEWRRSLVGRWQEREDAGHV